VRKILVVVALISLVFCGLSVAQAAPSALNCAAPGAAGSSSGGNCDIGAKSTLNGSWGNVYMEYPNFKSPLTLTVATGACTQGRVEIILSTKSVNPGSSWGTLDTTRDRVVKTINVGGCSDMSNSLVDYDSTIAKLPVGTYAFDILVPLWYYSPGSGAYMYAVYNSDYENSRVVLDRTNAL
jgi:hypothetical protein